MAVTLRGVVYRAAGSYEHLMKEGEPLTLCGRPPEHVNPGVVTRLPAPGDSWVEDYCLRCLRAGRLILSLPE